MTTSLAHPAFLDVTQPGFDLEAPEVDQAARVAWYADTAIGPLLLDYAHTSELCRDSRFHIDGHAFLDFNNVKSGPMFEWWTNTIGTAPTSQHVQFRSMITPALTKRAIDAQRGFIRDTCESLADALASGAEVDFMRAFASQLPARVMCQLLGIQVANFDEFHRWALAMGHVFGTPQLTPENVEETNWGIANLTNLMNDVIRERRHNLGTDLLSIFIKAEQDGVVSAKQLSAIAVHLIWAGQDTNERQLGRMIETFSRYPDQWTLLRHQPELIENAVEELLRWNAAGRMTVRHAREDLVFHGLDVKANQALWASLSTANRDPEAFDRADHFDITVSRDRRQMSFGGGLYYCLGAELARLELAEALRTLTSRFEPPKVLPGGRWRAGLAFVYGPESLPVQLSPLTPIQKSTSGNPDLQSFSQAE